MKFIFQLIGNILGFCIYFIIGSQTAAVWDIPAPEIQTLSWSGFFKTILFFTAIATLSILTTYAFTQVFENRRRMRTIIDEASQLDGTDFSREATVEGREESGPARVIDFLTDSGEKVHRETRPPTKKKKAGKTRNKTRKVR